MASRQPLLDISQLSLNQEQRRGVFRLAQWTNALTQVLEAVTHSPNALQILAGPGSGKTKVLTARIAYLVQQGLPPSQICAVTFTNKAASEMKERLRRLIGTERTDALVMGTFHALCAKFLRKHGKCISLPNNFTICDAEESKKIISKILKSYSEDLSCQSIQLKEGAVLASISKAKSRGLSAHELRREKTTRDPVHEMIARIYGEYTTVLKENNSLDFDDLLVFGVQLFTKEPKTVTWCRHILVDEFQDTNSMQYDMMVRLASAHQCITVVGDPDQSIYGWRSADVTNLGRMRQDFPATEQILLEENYRSTASILAASLAIVAEDKSRIAKSLRTSHPRGALPTLRSFTTEQAEADFIASEIKRLVAYSGGMLGWKDFVVLLRFNALSRVMEAALQKEGIPNRVLAGQKFFERLEIKDIVAYLQVIDNPSYTPAFNRAANTPARAIGEKSISELAARAKKLGVSSMDVAEQIFSGRTPDIKPAVKRKLDSFLRPVLSLRKMANEGASVPDLIRRLLDLINYEDHLKKSQQDWESRWENVQELINFASQTGDDMPAKGTVLPSTALPGTGPPIKLHQEGKDVINLVSDDEDDEHDFSDIAETPLRMFLQASMLSTDTETNHETQSSEKVIISTCHSAKGLEWPVVFVPAVEKGTFPFYRTEDIEEERRLLYVACTRAQGLLYLSHSKRRMAAGEWVTKELSEFVSAVLKKNNSLFSSTPPAVTGQDRCEIAKLLGRKAINESAVQQRIQEYSQTTKLYPQSAQQQARPASTLNDPAPRPDTSLASDPPVTIAPTSFTTARAHARPLSSSSTHIPPTSKHLPPSRQLATSSIARPRAYVQPRLPSISPVSCPSNQISEPSHPLISESAPGSMSLTALQALSTNSLTSMKSLGQPDVVPSQPPQSALSSGIKLAAGKRRLGMGRAGTGYPSKKLKGS